MMKNAFYYVLKILFNCFGHVGKLLDKKAEVNFKIYDVTTWETNNYNTHIAQHLKK